MSKRHLLAEAMRGSAGAAAEAVHRPTFDHEARDRALIKCMTVLRLTAILIDDEGATVTLTRGAGGKFVKGAK